MNGTPPAVAPPRRQHPARLAIAGALLPLAIAGALVLSASSTMTKARQHGVPADVAPFAVAMLEIVSLAGTLLWIVGPTPKLRRDAAVATLAASAVSLVAGWSAYGWFGAVAPIGLVVTVHLASEAWRENWRPAEVVDGATQLVAGDRRDNESAGSVGDSDDVGDTPDLAPGPEPAPLPEVAGLAPDVVAVARELLDREPGAGRPRVRAYLDEQGHVVTDHKVKALLVALRPLAAVDEGRSA